MRSPESEFSDIRFGAFLGTGVDFNRKCDRAANAAGGPRRQHQPDGECHSTLKMRHGCQSPVTSILVSMSIASKEPST
ncbi:MAG: hypothetical protein GDA48_16775 [Hormoscilla sp. GM102CHS1]|nr:hypothetical protein [Hormoscilla sp. GM102CHS1]